MKSSASLISSAFAAALLFASIAHATPTTAQFSLDVNSSCCGPAPYGTVSLTQNGTHEVDFSVSLFDPNMFVFTGQAGAFTFDLNIAPSNLLITLSADSISAGFSSTVVGGTPQAEHMAGFGKFNYAIQGDENHTQGGSTPIGQLLTFSVVDNSAPISISDFEFNSTGGMGSYFAADILNKPALGTPSTGFVGTDDRAQVTPEPATFLIAGAGLLGVGLFRRKRASN